MNIDFEDFWRDQAQGLPVNEQGALDSLLELLRSSANPIASFLCGQAAQAAFDAFHARELETQLLLQLESNQTAEHVALQFLMLFRARKSLEKLGVVLPETRIALLPDIQSSPFCTARMRQAAIASRWRNGLLIWSDAKCDSVPQHLAAACVLSSVLFGGLLDRALIKAWIARLHEPLTVAGGHGYAEFRKNFRGNDQAYLRRWFLDPITETLFARLPVQATPYFAKPKEFLPHLREMLIIAGLSEDEIPQSIEQLSEYAAAFWSVYGSQADVRYARGRLRTHSLRTDVWRRIMGCHAKDPCNSSTPSSQESGETPTDQPSKDQWIPLAPWYFNIREILKSKPAPIDIQGKLRAALISEPAASVAHLYVGWLHAMLTESAASKKTIQPSTAYRYFDLVSGYLLGIMGTTSPAECNIEDLAHLYKAVIQDAEEDERKTLAKGIREFQTYLHRHHGGQQFHEVEDILGDEASLHPVDANLVTEEDYQNTLQWLEARPSNKKSRALVPRAMAALTLLYRTGCRRREIFFLRICDVHPLGRTEILIRPHELRTLKSESATRKPGISAFLYGKERKLLKDIYAQKLLEVGGNPFSEAFLFAAPAEEGVPVIEISNLIMEGLREVTGDRDIHLHILRHSHGTLTELALRAIDFPQALSPYATFSEPPDGHLKDTYERLQHGKRYRSILIGAENGTTRAFGYAVARILGHSSPLVSWEHYLHHADLILYGMCCSTLPKLTGASYARLSGLPEPTISEYRALKSSHYPIPAVRRKYADRFNILPPTEPQKGKPGRPKSLINWIPLEKVAAMLDAWLSGNQDLDSLSHDTGISPAQVARSINTALQLCSKIGKVRQGSHFSNPKPPKGDAERTYQHWLEESLERAFKARPALTQQGIELHLSHLQTDKHDVAFKGLKELKQAKRYIRFLRGLGFEDRHLRLLVRDQSSDRTNELVWRRELGIGNEAKTKFTPAKNSRNSYKSWLGIQVLDPKDGSPRLVVTTTTFVLAGIGISGISSSTG